MTAHSVLQGDLMIVLGIISYTSSVYEEEKKACLRKDCYFEWDGNSENNSF